MRVHVFAGVPRVGRLTYNSFDAELSVRIEGRTPHKKYKEALQFTQMLCSELAEVDDDNEFERLLVLGVAQ